MMRRLERSHDHLIGYSFSGDVTDEEYRQAASELRDDIAEHGTVRLLFRLSDLSLSAFFRALDERFRFVKDHRDDIERVAIVSDAAATGLLGRLTDAIDPVAVETFPRDEEPKAWAWLE